MTPRAWLGRLAGVLLAPMLAAGCAPRDNVAESELKAGTSMGYYEVSRSGIVYVVGSIASMDAVTAGRPLPRQVSAYSAGGQPVVFEADGAGLEQRLQAEYARRHGGSR